MIFLEKTKTGKPAFWEKGGGYTNTGCADILADRKGRPKKALYVRVKGHLANQEHALLPVAEEDFIIYASEWRGDYGVTIYKVRKIIKEKEDLIAAVKEVATLRNDKWDKQPPSFLAAALAAAKEKTFCYHCREPHFIK